MPSRFWIAGTLLFVMVAVAASAHSALAEDTTATPSTPAMVVGGPLYSRAQPSMSSEPVQWLANGGTVNVVDALSAVRTG